MSDSGREPLLYSSTQRAAFAVAAGLLAGPVLFAWGLFGLLVGFFTNDRETTNTSAKLAVIGAVGTGAALFLWEQFKALVG
jgi:CHASE2 domain-containing sensor protein